MLKAVRELIDIHRLENSTDEDQANYFFKIISWIFILLNVIAYIFYMISSNGTYNPSLHFQVGIFQIISIILLYTKHRQFGGYFFLIVLWGGMTYDAFLSAGIYNPINYAYIMVITCALIAFGIRKAVIFAIATSLVYLILYALSMAHYYPMTIGRNIGMLGANAFLINYLVILWFVLGMQAIRHITVARLFNIIAIKDQVIRKSEYLYRNIVESDQTFYVCRYKSDGTIIFANHALAKSYGITKESMIGRKIYEFLSKEDAEEIRKLTASANSNNMEFKYKYQALKDGEWQEWSTRMVVNGAVEYQSIGRSLTEQMESEKIIFQMGLNQAKMELVEQLASEISHDIRTPLTVLSTSLYLLKKSDSLDGQKKYLSQISDVSSDLQKMMENLVSIIKIRDPISNDGITSIDLSKLVKRITEESEYLLKTKQKLEPYIEPDVVIDGNYNFLTRALNNLVVNAIQYTPTGGLINVSLKSEDDKAIIKIIDNGIGIPQEDLDKVFDRLYRSDNAKKFFENGSGLGLYIVKMVIDKHNGKIEVKSEVGKGTTFTITIPNVQSESNRLIAKTEQLQLPAPDNIIVGPFTAKSTGYQVQAASQVPIESNLPKNADKPKLIVNNVENPVTTNVENPLVENPLSKNETQVSMPTVKITTPINETTVVLKDSNEGSSSKNVLDKHLTTREGD